jgi:PKHD-type hydroxylase
MKGEWCYYKEYFPKDTCKYIIEEGLKLPVQDGKLGVDGTLITNSNWRKSKVRFIQKTDPNFAFLFESVWKMAIQANDEWFGFHISKLDYIQLAEYDSEYLGEYKKHHDVFWMNNDPYYHRKLTAVVQLTDPTEYEGGDLELCNPIQSPNVEEVRTQGTAFFFPSFLEHQATTVTKGTRYSLACWFDGPKWR